MREVVFGVGEGQDVAPEQAHRACAGLVAADDEVDLLDLALEEAERIDRRRACVGTPGDPLHAHRGVPLHPQTELLRGGIRQHAVEGAAVHRQRDRRSVDLDRRDGARADHLHRQLDRFDLTGRSRRGRQQRGCSGEQARAHDPLSHDLHTSPARSCRRHVDARSAVF